MSRQFDIAVVGATGAVGRTFLDILEQRRFPVGRVHAVASARSAGSRVPFGASELVVESLEDFDFSRVQIGLFSPGAAVSAVHAPRAAAAGCVVVDNTSYFRMEPDIPLVVPEVNPQALAGYRNRGIIANPNCSTIQMVVALKPIYDAVGIERINVATYQAVSGSGQKAVDELRAQTEAHIAGRTLPEPQVYARPIAFNVIPHIDVFLENGYTKEEMKMVWETRKILGDENIQVNPTTVRVPVFHGHAEALHIETRTKISADEARELLRVAPGVTVIDERGPGGYPTPAVNAAGRDAVFVGRIREDISHPRGLDLWVVADNVRKGAALNGVQIAEMLVKHHL
ncbi:MAG TPA: aspartate-semialdehyde dehydrogenase [Gammaproteobacteria bacterium]|nr:aspartate-semialdehyde dehydrogenase [Gammaproteobacteria bacterium]